jgi:hypothetical protein
MTPEERGIEVDYSIHKVYNQDKAMLDLETTAEDHYGIRLDNLFEHTKVWWTTTRCPYSDDPAVIYNNECFYGRMWGCMEIYTALPESGVTCGSALVHEFAHCLMMEMFNNDGDADHSSDIWALVSEAHNRACVREGQTQSFEHEWDQQNQEHIDNCEHID